LIGTAQYPQEASDLDMNPIQSEKLITLSVKNMLLDLGKDDLPHYARKTVSLVLKLDACEGLYIGRNEA
jgi:hypothetical protein